LSSSRGESCAPASGFDDVGELEQGAGNGQDDVDRLVCRGRIALEVDATVDCLVGWDGDRLQVRGRCGELDCLLGCSLSGSFEFAELWVHWGVGGDVGWGWNVLELRGWDVEEDFGPGGEGLDAEVFGGEVDWGRGKVSDADVGPGIAAFAGEEDHDAKAVGAEDFVVVAEDGVVDTACAWLADDNVIGLGVPGQIGREG